MFGAAATRTWRIVNFFKVLNIGRRLGGSMAEAAFVEWILARVVIGLVYKPISARTMS